MNIASEGLLDGSIYKEQIRLELNSVDRGVARYRRLAREAVSRGDGAALKPAERLMLYWMTPLTKALRGEHRSIKLGEPGHGRHLCGDIILKVKPVKLAVLVLHEMIGCCMTEPNRGITMSRLAMAVGRAAIAEGYVQDLKKMDREAGPDDPKPWWGFKNKTTRQTPKMINHFAVKVMGDEVRKERRMTLHTGMNLIWHVVGVCSISEEGEPFKRAFLHYRERRGEKTTGYMRMDPEVLRIIEQGHRIREHLRPRYEPMICTPLAWSQYREGGYVKLKQPVIRKIKPEQKHALDNSDLTKIFDAVNHLQATAWRINKPVLEVMETLWERGGNIAELPRREPEPLPERPDDIATNDEAKQIWKAHAAAVYGREAKRSSLALELDVYQLPLARRLAQREKFFFPHNLDFRGRVYPIPLYLNHYGGDRCRGLLEFAEGKPPGERGIYWLKVHAANCWGEDKVSFDDRVLWADAWWDQMVESATEPLMIEWWHQADKPFEFLAACMELVRCISDPDAVSHLPVQMDGSNNAAQQMAALGRDPVGAKACNLTPADEPEDLYGRVANECHRLCSLDISKQSQDVMPYINRKTVKTTTMTLCYRVSLMGARLQIEKQLKEQGYEVTTVKKSAIFLTDKVFEALSGTLVAAYALMEWFAECARLVSTAGEVLSWTNPLGLPVVQPYRSPAIEMIETCLQWIKMPSFDGTGQPLVKKNINGVTANFVHGVDASHCLMTAKAMSKRGMVFASVHDSFWTLACDVDEMQQVTRDQFIELHKRPLIQEVYQEWRTMYPKIDIPEPPPTGDFDIEEVRSSNYFFA